MRLCTKTVTIIKHENVSAMNARQMKRKVKVISSSCGVSTGTAAKINLDGSEHKEEVIADLNTCARFN